MNKDLDISRIPDQFVNFWWLSKIIVRFRHLVISKEQVYIFGGNNSWDTYRGHIIHNPSGKSLWQHIKSFIFVDK